MSIKREDFFMQFKYSKDLLDRDLLDLYISVGWVAYTRDPDKLKLAIENSTFVVTAWDGSLLVGLARCVSDDVAIMFLQDVLVRPSHHRLGIGRSLVTECLKRFDHVRQVVLLADSKPEQSAFYKSLDLTNIKEMKYEVLNAFVRIKD